MGLFGSMTVFFGVRLEVRTSGRRRERKMIDIIVVDLMEKRKKSLYIKLESIS